MRVFGHCLLGVCVTAGWVFAQAPPASPAQKLDPVKAEATLADARKALGGDKLAAVKTVVLTGQTRKLQGNNLVPIEFEIGIELPDKYVRKDEIPAQENDPTSSGFNGADLIQLPAPAAPVPPPARPGGPPPPTPEQLQAQQAAQRKTRVATIKQDFVRLTLGMFAASIPAAPLTFGYVGQAEAPQGRADVIDVKGEGTFALRFFVNSETHLPIMVSWQQPPTSVVVRVPGFPPPANLGAGHGRHRRAAASARQREPGGQGQVRQGRGRSAPAGAGEDDRVTALLRRLPRRRGTAVAVPAPARDRAGHDGGNDGRSVSGQREDRSEEIRDSEMIMRFGGFGRFRRFKLARDGDRALCSSCRLSLAQTRTDTAKVIVTVVDPSGGVIPNASVTIVGLEAATKATSIAPVKTTDKGLATFDALPPGRYSITGEFPGFDLGLLKDIRIKAGENKHVLVLPLRKMTDSVTVGRDAQQAAADRTSTFGTAMTREQIDALSDDPDEMARQLQDIAGPDAVLRIDSFEGGRLPPKAQIKSIHITRDAFAAENHFAGGIFIDVITQPGIGPLRGNANMRYHDGAWNGISPLTPTTRSPSMNGNFGGGLSAARSSRRRATSR